MVPQTNSTLNGATIRPEPGATRKEKLVRRIFLALGQSEGHIVNLQIIEADGELWLYVNGGKREVIE